MHLVVVSYYVEDVDLWRGHWTKGFTCLFRKIPYGGSMDTPVWHFPEKEYAKEESLQKCEPKMVPTCVLNPCL